jgi:hypothetical protein
MQELREMLRRELDKLQRKGSMSAGDLDLMYKVVDIIKDSYEIEEYAEAEHSHAGGHGGMSRVYMDGEYGGNSYRRQRRDSRGRYSREGGYSYDDGMAEVWEILEMMETGLPDEQREAIRRFRREMQK